MSIAVPGAPRKDAPRKTTPRRSPPVAGDRGRVLMAALVVAAVTAFAVPLLRYGLNPYDEGVVALGADQVLKGRRPNVDFYAPYPPGVFYVLAGLFRIAGTRLLVERAFALGCVVASVGVGYWLVTGLRPRPARRALPEVLTAGLVAMVAGCCMGLMWVTPVTGGALCLTLMSGLALRAVLPSGRLLPALTVGALFGLTMLWRTAFGGLGLFAALAVWLVRAGHTGALDAGRRRSRRCWGAVMLALGAALVTVPVFALLIKLGGERTYQSLFVWPFVSTQQADLPWPPLVPQLAPAVLAQQPLLLKGALLFQNWAYYFPLAALMLGAWRLCRPRALSATEIDVGLWLLLIGTGFFIYANGRTDYLHVLPLLLTSLLFAGLCVGGALGERPARRSWRRGGWLALGLGLAIPAVAALVPVPARSWSVRRALPARFAMELPAPRGAGILAPYRYSRQYGEVLGYLQSFVATGERLYSGSPRHDQFMVNDVMLYFLAERDPGSYFWCLDAGVTTTPAVQQQMLEELRANRVNWSVRWTAARAEPGQGGSSLPGATALDAALAAEYVTVERFGWYEVLRRVSGGAVAQVTGAPDQGG